MQLVQYLALNGMDFNVENEETRIIATMMMNGNGFCLILGKYSHRDQEYMYTHPIGCVTITQLKLTMQQQ